MSDSSAKPFLITLPAGLLPAAAPVAEPEPVASVPFIAPPLEAGAVPATTTATESATHRVPVEVTRVVQSEPRPAPRELSAEEQELHNTGVITRRAAATWRLDPQHGLPSIALIGPALLGRNPSPLDGRTDVVLVPIADPAKSVSKTHALVEPDGAMLWVTDLASTNGVLVTGPDGTGRLLEPGERTRIDSGSTLTLGEFVLAVLHR